MQKQELEEMNSRHFFEKVCIESVNAFQCRNLIRWGFPPVSVYGTRRHMIDHVMHGFAKFCHLGSPLHAFSKQAKIGLGGLSAYRIDIDGLSDYR